MSAAEPATRAPVRPLPLRQLLLRAATVLVVVAAVLFVGLAVRVWMLTSRTDPAAEALQAARTRTVEVLSYDSAALDDDLARARAQLTGDFARQFEQVAASLIEPASRERGVVTRAEVARAAVVTQDADRIEALLFVSQVTTSAADPTPRLSTSELVVTMAEVDGQWLIAQLRPV